MAAPAGPPSIPNAAPTSALRHGICQAHRSADDGTDAAAEFSTEIPSLNAARTTHWTRCRRRGCRLAFLWFELNHLSLRDDC